MSKPQSAYLWRRKQCIPCRKAYEARWREKNPEKLKRSKLLRNRRARQRSILDKKSPRLRNFALDIYRRAIMEEPPPLSSEQEALAYFRGYLAGASHGDRESAFLEKHKDLAFRIASEYRRKMGIVISYEEAVSAAYRKLLELARKAEEPDRSVVAAALRHGIIDEARALGNRRAGKKGRGPEVRLSTDISQERLRDDFSSMVVSTHRQAEALPREILERLEAEGLTERESVVLEMLSRGCTQGEVGRKLGFTESRANQVIREIREKHGELLLRLLQPA